ncbi:spirocyclase AveC family protein [Mycobacterium sp.]|uniref:spirocyclase AveC family protein n=1 Tax=Mycobacterium sp. TaxID=1785 RepID=UPI003C713B3D
MNSVKTLDRGPEPETPERFGRLTRWGAIIVGVVAVVFAALNSSRSVEGTRVGRPEGSFVPSRTEFLGISNWYIYFEIGSLVMFFAVWGMAIVRSRRREKPTPTLLMIAVTTSLTWLDPIMNWAPYAAYDPRMFHFDVDWFWLNLAPTVEPWAVIIGYGYFFLLPAWFTLAVYRRLAAWASAGSWMVRRPKLAVLALSIPFCIVWDGVMEALFVRMGFYTYTQVIPWGSIFNGTPHQFPLIWEAVLFGIMLSVAAPLMWVDDTGRTWSETVARRTKIFAKRPYVGALVIAWALMSVVYLGYGLSFGIIRATGIATETAQPWRYPETKVFDPQGYYQRNGEPGPFMIGTWSGWESKR